MDEDSAKCVSTTTIKEFLGRPNLTTDGWVCEGVSGVMKKEKPSP